MELVLRNKNSGDSGGTVGEEEVDFAIDLRLARRWKRRGFDYGNIWLKSCSNKSPNKSMHQNTEKNDALVEAERVDSLYKKIPDDMEHFVDVDVGVDTRTRCTDEASNKAMHLNNKKDDAVVEAVRVDSDNEKFLNDMEQIVDDNAGVDNEARPLSDVDVDDDGDDDNVNQVFRPRYMMLLDNLKEDGKSHVLERALGETSLVVKYKEEYSSKNGLDMENLKTAKHHQKHGKIRTQNVFKCDSEREKIENPRIVLRSHSGRQKTESPKKNLRSKFKRKNNLNTSMMHDIRKTEKIEIARTLRSNSRNNERSSLLPDPLKINKGGSARTLGKAFRRERTGTQKKLRAPVVKKNVECNDEDHVSSAENVCSSKRHDPEGINSAKNRCNNGVKSDLVDESYLEFLKLMTDIQSHTPEGRKKVVSEELDSDSQVEMEPDDPVSLAKNVCSSKRHSPGAANSVKHQYGNGVKSDLVDESYLEFLKLVKDGQDYTAEGGKEVVNAELDSDSEVEMEADGPVSSAKNICSSKRHSPDGTNSAKHQYNNGVKCDLVDESDPEYLKFLDVQHYAPEGGKKVVKGDQHLENVIYDENDSDSDSEVIILDNNPFSDETTLFVDLDDEDCIENPTGCVGSEFREKLMEILRKPYDTVEYEKLWQEASHRRPLQGVRILRKLDKTYQLNSYGKSYLELDGYSDLAKVIHQAGRDKRRKLNLLRGFFYWLQNLACNGVFKPWLDSSCLRTLPPPPLGTALH